MFQWFRENPPTYYRIHKRTFITLFVLQMKMYICIYSALFTVVCNVFEYIYEQKNQY